MFKQVRHRQLLVAPQHLADTVVDDDRVVERIAENGQQRGDRGQVEIDLHHRHEAEREHEIVHVGDHGAERELPLEAEPEIDQDRADRRDDAERAIGQELARHARSDHLDAAIFDLLAERRPDLVDRCLLRLLAARLLRDADQHVGRPAELLQLDIAELQRRSASCASCRDRPDRPWSAVRSACRRVKSMPRLRPGWKNRTIATIDSSAEIGKLIRRKLHEIELGIVRDDPQQRNAWMKAHVLSRQEI